MQICSIKIRSAHWISRLIVNTTNCELEVIFNDDWIFVFFVEPLLAHVT